MLMPVLQRFLKIKIFAVWSSKLGREIKQLNFDTIIQKFKMGDQVGKQQFLHH